MKNAHLFHHGAATAEHAAIAEAVAEQDRHYFEEHPGEAVYVRPAVAGELGPPREHYDGKLTIVTQLRPGVRLRRLISVGPTTRTS